MSDFGYSPSFMGKLAEITQNGTKKLVTLPSGATVTIPAANLKAWYKAESITGVNDGGYIKTLPDSSGNNYDLTSSADKTDPILRANQVNGLPLIEFSSAGGHGDGSPYPTCLNINNIPILDGVSGATFFFVCKLNKDYVDSGAGIDNQMFFISIDNENAKTKVSFKLQDTFGVRVRRITGETIKYSTTPTVGLYKTTRVLSVYECVIDYANGTMKTYIDGRLIATDNLTSSGVANSTGSKVAMGNIYPNYLDDTYAYNGYIGEAMVYGDVKTDTEREEIRNYLMSKWNIEEMDGRFGFELETANNQIDTPVAVMSNLSLIAVKTFNNYTAEGAVVLPNVIGYLYLDQDTQKLYYSSGRYDNPKYLCDWDATITPGGTVACENYIATITNAGDIIFLRRRATEDPIIYPAGNYSNPSVIDFGEDTPPCGPSRHTGFEHDCNNDFFLFCEYFNPATDGNDVSVWKVISPYSNKANWTKVLTLVQHDGETPGADPTHEIRHFHCVDFDPYSGTWWVSTGDYDYQCRVFKSIDSGANWTEVASNGQKYRNSGLVFTENYIYYGNDTGTNHALYRLGRDGNGVPDFSTLEVLGMLSVKQPTYDTCLVREPAGILFLDRAEERTDYILDVTFWSFEFNRLYRLGTVEKMDGDTGETDGRFGFGNLCTTTYQPSSENGIVCGANSLNRPLSVAVLGNTLANRLGNLKIKVVQKY